MKIIQTLEFDKIRQQVLQYAQTELAKEYILKMEPSSNIIEIETWQNETEESLSIIEQKKTMPIPRLKNVSLSIKRLSLGASLNGQELSEIGKLLTSTHQLISFFASLAEDQKVYPALNQWVNSCVSLPNMSKMIEESVDDEGNILTSASIELATIRRNQINTEQQIRNSLNQILKSKAKLLSDSLITIRNQRFVVPVKAEYRNQINGTVHDQSSTGQTIYLEPQSVVNLNNKLAELKIKEKQEIERILIELSYNLMPYIEEIRQNQLMISQLDYIQARAEYAKQIEGSKPIFSIDQHVAIWQGRHPLINPKDIVANDIFIGEEYRSLIITGPNTGGKTILLKTLGILQLMGQSGLQIPAESGSQLGIFDQIFADIGDEQSIEQSLSTFSSHMTRIIDILDKATYASLILFDELGSGTDPQEGAALAMAILDYVRNIGAMVMATTHYPELKLYANQTPKTINASMEFDIDTLSPTYRLLIGVPGRSNAMEISKRLGLPDSIIKQAREGISQDDQSINEMVANLEREKRASEQAYLKADRYLEDSEKLFQDLRKEYNRWLEMKAGIIEQAKQNANQSIKEREAEADKIISEIRGLQLEQGQNQTIKEHILLDKKAKLSKLHQKESLKKNKVLKQAKQKKAFKVGDEVEVLSYGQRGSIIEKSNDHEFIVQMGILKMKIHESDLKVLKKVENKSKVNIQRRAGTKVKTSLDIRGERYDAGLSRLSQYLDQALLSNHPMVTIIHGKGTGALRKGVQDLLNQHPQVDRYEYSPPNAGGDGSTIVYFK